MFERMGSNAVALSDDQFPSSVQMEFFIVQRLLGLYRFCLQLIY